MKWLFNFKIRLLSRKEVLMQGFRILIGSIFWPIIIIAIAARSSIISLFLGLLTTVLGIGIALIVPSAWLPLIVIVLYLIGAILFFSIVNSKNNHTTGILVNLILCGLLVGTILVFLFRKL